MKHAIPMSSTLALALALTGAARAQVSAGDAAPAFEFAESLSKQAPSYQALRGKVLMLDFFATW